MQESIMHVKYLIIEVFILTELITKNIPEEQYNVNSTSNLFGGVLYYFINTGNEVPGWWSFRREDYLHDQTIKNDFLSSLVNTIVLKLFGLPFQITANNTSIQQHNNLAVEYNNLLRYSFSRNQTLEKFIRSVIVHDNGGYLFIQSDDTSDKPLSGMPSGLMHLDSTKVQRTGNLEYPILYYHPNGSIYKVHESRLISLVQSPSTKAESYGVGHGFVSKAILLSQHLYDIYLYEGEVLGSQSAEEIIYATGSKSDDIKQAFDIAEIDSKNAGLNRFGKRVFMGIRDPQGKLGKLNLKSLPEQFDKRNDIEITLTLLAMASGGSPNWFYDSVKSGSTKASAAESTKMGESKLETWYIQSLSEQIELKFCPNGNSDKLRVLGGLFDVDNNGIKSRIKLNRAQARNLNITSGVTDIRSERLLQLEAAEIAQSVFNDLELNDLRLPNGLHVKTLFYTNDATLKKMLLFIDKPLSILNEEEIEDSTIDLLREAIASTTTIVINSSSPMQQNNAKIALVALEWLLAEYTNIYNSSVLPDENILGSEQLDLNPGHPPLSNKPLPEITPSVTNKVTTESKNKPKPNFNTTSNGKPLLNQTIKTGLNDDGKIDNEKTKEIVISSGKFLTEGELRNKVISVNQSAFSTVKLRKLRSDFRTVARQLWNGEITAAEFTSRCNGIIIEDGQFKDSMFEYTKTLQSYIISNSRINGGKLASVYKLVDQFIVHRT
jgi:hypothetical protein